MARAMAATTAADDQPAAVTRVVLWSLPKIVFFYPTFLVSLLAGALVYFWPSMDHTWALLFLAVFAVNLLVIAFDFPWTSAFLMAALLMLGLVILLWVNAEYVRVVPWLGRFVRHVTPQANDEFYWLMGGALGLIYLLIAVGAHWYSRWEVESRELRHKHGPLGNVQQMPTATMTYDKEITDVFEYLLLRSGRLVLFPVRGRPIVLEHVPGINRKDKQLKRVLRSVITEHVNESSEPEEMPPLA